ncbi:MAG: hypothetical protein ACYCXD_08775, partial [Coriobacteriia bacterium]
MKGMMDLGEEELRNRLLDFDQASPPGVLAQLRHVSKGVRAMRRLTFEGYLGSYVRQLAGQNTSSLSSLVRRAQTEPRLVEPLLLWAVVSGRADRLSRLLDGQLDRERDLKTLVALWEEGRLESELATNGPSLKSEFTKVW